MHSGNNVKASQPASRRRPLPRSGGAAAPPRQLAPLGREAPRSWLATEPEGSATSQPPDILSLEEYGWLASAPNLSDALSSAPGSPERELALRHGVLLSRQAEVVAPDMTSRGASMLPRFRLTREDSDRLVSGFTFIPLLEWCLSRQGGGGGSERRAASNVSFTTGRDVVVRSSAMPPASTVSPAGRGSSSPIGSRYAAGGDKAPLSSPQTAAGTAPYDFAPSERVRVWHHVAERFAAFFNLELSAGRKDLLLCGDVEAVFGLLRQIRRQDLAVNALPPPHVGRPAVVRPPQQRPLLRETVPAQPRDFKTLASNGTETGRDHDGGQETSDESAVVVDDRPAPPIQGNAALASAAREQDSRTAPLLTAGDHSASHNLVTWLESPFNRAVTRTQAFLRHWVSCIRASLFAQRLRLVRFLQAKYRLRRWLRSSVRAAQRNSHDRQYPAVRGQCGRCAPIIAACRDFLVARPGAASHRVQAFARVCCARCKPLIRCLDRWRPTVVEHQRLATDKAAVLVQAALRRYASRRERLLREVFHREGWFRCQRPLAAFLWLVLAVARMWRRSSIRRGHRLSASPSMKRIDCFAASALCLPPRERLPWDWHLCCGRCLPIFQHLALAMKRLSQEGVSVKQRVATRYGDCMGAGQHRRGEPSSATPPPVPAAAAASCECRQLLRSGPLFRQPLERVRAALAVAVRCLRFLHEVARKVSHARRQTELKSAPPVAKTDAGSSPRSAATWPAEWAAPSSLLRVGASRRVASAETLCFASRALTAVQCALTRGSNGDEPALRLDPIRRMVAVTSQPRPKTTRLAELVDQALFTDAVSCPCSIYALAAVEYLCGGAWRSRGDGKGVLPRSFARGSHLCSRCAASWDVKGRERAESTTARDDGPIWQWLSRYWQRVDRLVRFGRVAFVASVAHRWAARRASSRAATRPRNLLARGAAVCPSGRCAPVLACFAQVLRMDVAELFQPLTSARSEFPIHRGVRGGRDGGVGLVGAYAAVLCGLCRHRLLAAAAPPLLLHRRPPGGCCGAPSMLCSTRGEVPHGMLATFHVQTCLQRTLVHRRWNFVVRVGVNMVVRWFIAKREALRSRRNRGAAATAAAGRPPEVQHDTALCATCVVFISAMRQRMLGLEGPRAAVAASIDMTSGVRLHLRDLAVSPFRSVERHAVLVGAFCRAAGCLAKTQLLAEAVREVRGAWHTIVVPQRQRVHRLTVRWRVLQRRHGGKGSMDIAAPWTWAVTRGSGVATTLAVAPHGSFSSLLVGASPSGVSDGCVTSRDRCGPLLSQLVHRLSVLLWQHVEIFDRDSNIVRCLRECAARHIAWLCPSCQHSVRRGLQAQLEGLVNKAARGAYRCASHLRRRLLTLRSRKETLATPFASSSSTANPTPRPPTTTGSPGGTNYRAVSVKGCSSRCQTVLDVEERRRSLHPYPNWPSAWSIATANVLCEKSCRLAFVSALSSDEHRHKAVCRLLRWCRRMIYKLRLAQRRSSSALAAAIPSLYVVSSQQRCLVINFIPPSGAPQPMRRVRQCDRCRPIFEAFIHRWIVTGTETTTTTTPATVHPTRLLASSHSGRHPWLSQHDPLFRRLTAEAKSEASAPRGGMPFSRLLLASDRCMRVACATCRRGYDPATTRQCRDYVLRNRAVPSRLDDAGRSVPPISVFVVVVEAIRFVQQRWRWRTHWREVVSHHARALHRLLRAADAFPDAAAWLWVGGDRRSRWGHALVAFSGGPLRSPASNDGTTTVPSFEKLFVRPLYKIVLTEVPRLCCERPVEGESRPPSSRGATRCQHVVHTLLFQSVLRKGGGRRGQACRASDSEEREHWASKYETVLCQECGAQCRRWIAAAQRLRRLFAWVIVRWRRFVRRRSIGLARR